jgi:hypothetical protein
MISDCQKAEIFQVGYIVHTPFKQVITPVVPLKYVFDKHAEIGRIVSNTYFIKDGSLIVRDIHRHQVSLINGVEKITIRYAIKQDGIIIEVPSSQVRDWSQIKGVNIDMVLSKHHIRKTWHAFISLKT